ncbi:hypothetical protein [Sphingopyxis sp.]|uniref:hypothetical protein n=1 Tax=Sphingopyxis sp. TaxID=1908224 RepID=UPI0035B04F01
MIGAALLLLALEPPPAPPPPASLAVAPLRFAPPVGEPMTYRVTSRRRARDGSMASYTLVYALQWERAGRGVQLAATLRRIESDARPELVQALTGLLRPLIGQTISYLVAADGGRVDMIDPDAQWARVLGKVQSMGAGAGQGEAKQVAGLLASLPPAERDKLATADIRALVAPANPALADGASDLKVEQAGNRRTITRIERPAAAGGPDARPPIEIATSWTIDTATGLILGERRATWVAGENGSERRLVEERIRDLAAGDPR